MDSCRMSVAQQLPTEFGERENKTIHHAIADAYANAQLLLLSLDKAQRTGLATAADLLELEKSQRWLGRRR